MSPILLKASHLPAVHPSSPLVVIVSIAGVVTRFPPDNPCSGDPEASAEDSTCSADQSCVQCKCLPLGCDCDPSAEDPNSFCPSGDVCKVIRPCVPPMSPHTLSPGLPVPAPLPPRL